MPGVPRQLRLVLARPAELRPAIRQLPQQQRQLRPLRPDRNPILEPVVLRLDPRRRLHPTDRPQPRLPVLPPHMTHHRLVTPRIPVIPNQRLVNQTNLARRTLPQKPPVAQSLLDRLHPSSYPSRAVALPVRVHLACLPPPDASGDSEPRSPSPPDPSPAASPTPPSHASSSPPEPQFRLAPKRRRPPAGALRRGPAAHPQLPPDSPAALALLPPTARRARPRQRVGPPLVQGLVGEGPDPRAGPPTPTPNPPQSLEEAPDPAAHGQHPDGAPADPRALCRFRPRRSATSVNCSSPSPRLMPPRNAPRTTPTTSPSSSPPPGWASSPYFSYARPEAHPREPQPVDEDDGYPRSADPDRPDGVSDGRHRLPARGGERAGLTSTPPCQMAPPVREPPPGELARARRSLACASLRLVAWAPCASSAFAWRLLRLGECSGV